MLTNVTGSEEDESNNQTNLEVFVEDTSPNSEVI